MIEDHPLYYGYFEGVIPEGLYGAGEVIVWDRGTWTNETESDGRPHAAGEAVRSGHIRFSLEGEKVRGSFVLRRMQGKQWLLMKLRDQHASKRDVVTSQPESIMSGVTVEDLAQ